MTRTILSTLSLTVLTFFGNAQFGTYDKDLAGSVAEKPLVVVLENNNSSYNAALKSAVEKFWTNGTYSFTTLGDVGASGYLPTNNYLAHTVYTDPKTFEMNHLSVIAGWKMKKGDRVETEGSALAGIPAEQVIAGILFDPERINDGGGFMMDIYVKHLQDYAQQVKSGKIVDHTTASRLYESRTRHIKDGDLLVMEAHKDKTFPETMEEVKEIFPSKYEIVDNTALQSAVEAPDRSTYVTDVVLTGEYKTKHCFKRVFNTATGELVFLHDEQSLYGKKEGFLLDDFKSIARSR
jgi:hypothetical protein